MIKNKSFKQWSGFWLASIFYLYEYCLQVSPTVMTDALMLNYNTTAVGIGMISGFYFYAYALMQIPVGFLYDRWSTRLILGVASLFCALSTALFTYCPNIYVACFARFLMGMGSSCAFIAIIIFVRRWFQPHYFATLIGVAQLMSSLGAISAETPLVYAIDALGWHITLLVMSVFGIILSIAIWFFADDGRPSNQQPQLCWSIEKQKLKRLLSNRQTMAIGFYTLFIWTPITAFAGLWGVPFMKTAYQISSYQAATYSAIIWVTIGLASPAAGWLSDCFQNRKKVLASVALLGIIGSMGIIYFPIQSCAYISIQLSLFGIAAVGQALSFSVIHDNHTSEDIGAASGINNMFPVAGSAVAQPLIGLILEQVQREPIINNIPHYSVENYQWALALIPLCFLSAFLIACLGLRESYPGK